MTTDRPDSGSQELAVLWQEERAAHAETLQVLGELVERVLRFPADGEGYLLVDAARRHLRKHERSTG